MKKKFYFRMVVAILLLIIGLVFALSYDAQAAPAIQIPVEEFSSLDGSAAYIRYYNNYSLDIEEDRRLGSFTELLNSFANVIFNVVKMFGIITVIIFYWCMDFDLAHLFHDQISDMQAALNNGIFEPLFILGFCGSAIILLKKMLQRDMMGAYGQILKVIGITVLSLLVVRESSTVISATTNITKDVGTQALVGIQGEENVTITSYAAQTAAELWNNMVHVPWVFFEFGGEEPEGGIEYQILSLPGSSQERQDIVNSYQGNAFSEDRVAEKIGVITVYLLPFGIKCVIYILLALLTLVCQLIAIFYVLLAPLVLLLSMMPGYEGLISAWLRKMLESQLSMLIVYFLMGLITKFDNMLYEACAGAWGWMVVMVVELVIEILIFVKRDELLGALSNIQKSVSPNYARTMMLQRGNVFQLADRGINVAAKVVGTGIKMSGGEVGAAVDVAQKSKKVKKDIAKEKVVRESEDQVPQKEEATVKNTSAKQKPSDRHVENSGQKPVRVYYVYDGDSSSHGRKHVTVERPVMIGSRDSNKSDVEFQEISDTYETINVAESAQKPRREVLRPRMDVETNVIQFEDYRANLEADIESEIEVQQLEQGESRKAKASNVEHFISNPEVAEEHLQVKRPNVVHQEVKAQNSEKSSSQMQAGKKSTVKSQKPTQKVHTKPKDVVAQNNVVADAPELKERQATEKNSKATVRRPRYSDMVAETGK